MKTVHEERNDFECQVCYKAFGHKPNLNRLMKTVHEERKDFECKVSRPNINDRTMIVRY